jgi:two-component system, sensor histidine kinase and response regulator
MNSGQLDFPRTLKSFKNTATGKNGDQKPQGSETTLTVTGKGSEKHIRVRLRELEERNAHLENLVEQRTRKLIEVVATNTKFISIIAHDLRSPFNAIIGVLDTLKASLVDFSLNDIQTLVNIASDSANRTLGLLDNLLAWTLSQNKEKNFNPVKINLPMLIKEEVASFSISSRYKQIRLHHFIRPNLNILGDLQMVKTILRNLICNAIKFTNPGGEIAITAFAGNSFVEVAVKDNGIGISAEVQEELFKISSHHTTTGTCDEQGTGLGLILCKEFVEIHGGKIWVESEPGNGSTFRFTLPHFHKE